MTVKKALVLGASGLTGRECLDILLQSPCYAKVIVLVRRPLGIKHPKLQEAVVDFDFTAPLEAYYEGVDDVFCCLGTDLKSAGGTSTFRRVDFHIPTEAANIASGHHVKQFLAISTHGADNHSSDVYKRVKGELEAGLEQFSFTGLHIRPVAVKAQSKDTASGKNFFLRIFGGGGNNPEKKPITAASLAKAMVNAALLGKAGNNRYSASQILKLSEREVNCSGNAS